MKIELHEIPVREVAEGYVDSAENGVRGYEGRQDGGGELPDALRRLQPTQKRLLNWNLKAVRGMP